MSTIWKYIQNSNNYLKVATIEQNTK
jgi:hypothetical protein